jgi:hypothetical protein
MLPNALKAVAWTVGGLIGVAVAIYAVAVVVNFRDQPPSADALTLTASYQSRPALADDENAFIYLLGFDAPLGDDPQEVGARRLAWMQGTSATPFDEAGDPLTNRLVYRSTDPLVEQFLTACENDSRECALAFDESGVVFESWSASHPWLLERYLTLIAHSGWRESVFDLSRPFPGYAPAIHGQRLLLLQAKALVDNGDTQAANVLLSSDVRFWRTVLASSDLLITKMIATAALHRHFAWGSLAMRNFPAERAATDVPGEWRRPLSDTELSLRRTLVGEWIFFSSMPALTYADLGEGETFVARTSDQLMRPFFQEQDTLNRHATYLNELAETLDAPLVVYESAADRASQLASRTANEAFQPHSLYNLVGSLMMADPADYSSYARRVADLEGVRRAALAVVTLRDAATPGSDLGAALTASPLRNPYDNQPLRWDAQDRAVVFVGLEPGERGEHRFYY